MTTNTYRLQNLYIEPFDIDYVVFRIDAYPVYGETFLDDPVIKVLKFKMSDSILTESEVNDWLETCTEETKEQLNQICITHSIKEISCL